MPGTGGKEEEKQKKIRWMMKRGGGKREVLGAFDFATHNVGSHLGNVTFVPGLEDGRRKRIRR